jgi:hypothetical protein
MLCDAHLVQAKDPNRLNNIAQGHGAESASTSSKQRPPHTTVHHRPRTCIVDSLSRDQAEDFKYLEGKAKGLSRSEWLDFKELIGTPVPPQVGRFYTDDHQCSGPDSHRQMRGIRATHSTAGCVACA